MFDAAFNLNVKAPPYLPYIQGAVLNVDGGKTAVVAM
jgi:hypothetical protein